MYVCKHYVRVGGELRFPGEVLEEGEVPEEALRRLLERGAIETVDGGDPSGAGAVSPADEAEKSDAEAAEIDAMAGFVDAPGRKSASKGGRRK